MVSGLAERVGAEAGLRRTPSADRGRTWSKQRVVRIAGPDAGQVGPGHQERKVPAASWAAASPLAESEQPAELAGVGTASASAACQSGSGRPAPDRGSPVSTRKATIAIAQSIVTEPFRVRKQKQERRTWPPTTPANSARD